LGAKHIIQAGDFQRLTLDGHGYQRIPERGDAGSLEAVHQPVGRVEVMIPQTRPLSIRSADSRQRLIERRVKLATAMGQEVAGMHDQIGLGVVREPHDV
jgi:hypothetical protein